MLIALEKTRRFRLATIGCGLVLVAIGTRLPSSQATTDPESAIMVAVWFAATAMLLWLVASVAYWRRYLTTPAAKRRRFERFCLPGSQRLAAVLVVSIAVVPACAPSTSSAPELSYIGEVETPTTKPTTTLVLPTTVLPTTVLPTSSTTASTIASTIESTIETAPVDEVPPDPVEPLAEPASNPAPTEYTVKSGDHLWGIAESTLTDHLSTPPTMTQTTTYWAELIRLNKSRLRSGDPSLIYPGEVLALPTLDA